jgi:hypothetical protein
MTGGGYGTKAGARKNPWLLHVKKVAHKHVGATYKEILQLASLTYKKKPAARKVVRRIQVVKNPLHGVKNVHLVRNPLLGMVSKVEQLKKKYASSRNKRLRDL